MQAMGHLTGHVDMWVGMNYHYVLKVYRDRLVMSFFFFKRLVLPGITKLFWSFHTIFKAIFVAWKS